MGKLWGLYDGGNDMEMLADSPTRAQIQLIIAKVQVNYTSFAIEIVTPSGEQLMRTVFEDGQGTTYGLSVMKGNQSDAVREYGHVVEATDNAIWEWAKNTGPKGQELERYQKLKKIVDSTPKASMVLVVGKEDGWFDRDIWCDDEHLEPGFVVTEDRVRFTHIYRDPKNGSLWAPTRRFV